MKRSFLSKCVLVIGIIVHLTMIGSLLSEPLFLDHGTHLNGTPSHPLEKVEFRGYLDPWFHDTDRVPRGLDFFSIYQAGHNFMRGQSVYFGVRVHDLGQDALVVPYFSGFRYLPAYAIVYGTLLNTLQPWPSYWAWFATVEFILLINLWLIRKLPVSKHLQRSITAMWLIFSPYYVEIHIGQQSMVTVTLIHLALISYYAKRETWRDLAYTASVLWKINTILFLPIWVKLKRWRTILLLFCLIIFSSGPYFLAVPGSFPEFMSYFRHDFIAAGPNSLGLSTLLIQILQHGKFSHELCKTVTGTLGLGVIVIASLATLAPRRIRFDIALSMWICVYFLSYKYVWEHHYVMILPILAAGFTNKRLRPWTYALWLFCALPTPYILLNDPSSTMPQIAWNLMQRVFYHSTKIIPVAVYFMRLVWELFKGRPAGASNEPIAHNNDQLDLSDILMRAISRQKT